MDGDGTALVLNNEAFMGSKVRAQPVDLGAQGRMVLRPAGKQVSRDPVFDPVEPRRIEAMRGEAFVKKADRPPAHQGQRPAEHVAKLEENRRQRRINDDGIRALHDIDEGAVKVEEEGPVGSLDLYSALMICDCRHGPLGHRYLGCETRRTRL
jgi:hypothetical protein